MMKKLGCLHAHHANIAYVDQALQPYDVEVIHFVDPGLHQQGSVHRFGMNRIRSRVVMQQLNWNVHAGWMRS
jgi:hypothetical protein